MAGRVCRTRLRSDRCFLIYFGMSWRSAVPAYYFLLHPVSTLLVHLHTAALDVSHLVERRDHLARDEVSAGGVAKRDGVDYRGGSSPSTSFP